MNNTPHSPFQPFLNTAKALYELVMAGLFLPLCLFLAWLVYVVIMLPLNMLFPIAEIDFPFQNTLVIISLIALIWMFWGYFTSGLRMKYFWIFHTIQIGLVLFLLTSWPGWLVTVPAAWLGRWLAYWQTRKFKMERPLQWPLRALEVVGLLAIAVVMGIFFVPYPFMHHSSCGMYKSITIEAASMIAGSFQVHQNNSQLHEGTTPGDLTQYMQWVKLDTSTHFRQTEPWRRNSDPWPSMLSVIQYWNEPLPYIGEELQPCSETHPCLLLHNGGVLQYDVSQTFGGNTASHALFFNLDPDGHGPRGKISLYQYYNGRLTTGGMALPGTITNGTLQPQAIDPDYSPGIR